ncbi:MAG: dephospho-CoA kinase [Bacteroidota bacterium]|nr:dephospho-CoA kinase [Bacteroidota bacterium]
MILKVGLTGGIGSGKTLVAKEFTKLWGIPVYNADESAKNLISVNQELQKDIKECFGESIFDDYKLNRKKLADIVFTDKLLLNKLNMLVHPFVRKDFKKWADNNKQFHYVIEEAAILFETGIYKDFDKIITVIAPEELRIERVCRRDNRDEEFVRSIIANQTNDDTRIRLSDYIIINNGMIPLDKQINKIHNSLVAITNNG